MLVIATTPVRIAGSYTGANNAEWIFGSGLPVFFDSASLAGSATPNRKAERNLAAISEVADIL